MKQDVFEKKVKEKFNNSFDFTNVIYKGCYEKITITCRKHGEINITPSNLLKNGCPLCGKEKKFINKAKLVHKNKYDYSNVVYQNTNTNVCIICPEHGEFWQKPNCHLNGCGCQKCMTTKKRDKNILNNEDWVKLAKAVHGSKYDYSKVLYKGFNEKVCIICPEHGEFWQKAIAHTSRKSGCPKCGEIKSKTESLDKGKTTFIKKLKTLNKLYDTNALEYKGSLNPITVICKKHGNFVTTPAKLFSTKTPCPKCREELKKPKIIKKEINHFEIFKNKLNEKYPNRFSFKNTIYKNINENILLYDKILNELIEVKPTVILKSKTLYKLECYKTTKLPLLTFINKANKIHNNKYDYSKVDYKHSKKKVCIICPEHGEFWQTPNEHIKGSGCSLCAGNVKINENEFFEKVKKIHGNRYDYSQTVLLNQVNEITVICPEHGEFKIRPMHHLKGSGCPKCKGSSGEKILLTFFENKNLYPHFNKLYKWLDYMQLDFYFPEHKLAIEVQGEQHFIETNFFQSNLDENIRRDNKKRQLCEQNGVKLLYYAPYNMDFPYKVYTNVNELYEEMKKYMLTPIKL